MPPGMRSGMTLGFALALMTFVSVTANAQAHAANGLPETTATLWLDSASGPVSGVDGSVLLLSSVAPTGSSPAQALFVPILEQVGLSRHSISWYDPSARLATTDIARDAAAEFDLFVGASVTTRLHVQLQGVSPNGTLTTVAQAEDMLSLQNILPNHVSVLLTPTGSHLARGDAVRLEVSVDDVNVLTWIQYDAATAPGHVALTTRVTDSDGDGIPDDVDTCPLDSDCDGDTIVDGDQVAYYNSTTNAPVSYRDYYYDYGQPGGTTGPGQPGAPGTGTPGGPGTPGNPFPQPGQGGGDGGPATANNYELGVGVAMGGGSLLLALGGLFGRHPL